MTGIISLLEVSFDVFSIKEYITKLAIGIHLGLIIEMRRRGITLQAAYGNGFGGDSLTKFNFGGSLIDLAAIGVAATADMDEMNRQKEVKKQRKKKGKK